MSAASVITPIHEGEPYMAYFSDRDSTSISCGTIQNPSNRPEWMREMGPKLMNAKVGEIIWPGTHDSGAYCEEFDFSKVVHRHWLRYVGTHLLSCLCKTARQFASEWSHTQTLSIRQQLEHGVRYIDLKISKCSQDGDYYIVHSFCGPNLKDILQDMADFLAEHNGECVLVEVNPVSGVDHIELHDIFERNLGQYLLKREHGVHHFSPTTLALSHLIEKGRVVILYRLPPLWGFMDRVLCFWDLRCIHAPFVMSLDPKTKEDYQLEEFTHFSSRYHGVHEKKHKYIFHFMYALTPTFCEILKSSSLVQYFGSAEQRDDPASLQECAQRFNPKLSKFIERINCHVEAEQCHDIGMIVSVDFVEESELLTRVIELNMHKFKSSRF